MPKRGGSRIGEMNAGDGGMVSAVFASPVGEEVREDDPWACGATVRCATPAQPAPDTARAVVGKKTPEASHAAFLLMPWQPWQPCGRVAVSMLIQRRRQPQQATCGRRRSEDRRFQPASLLVSDDAAWINSTRTTLRRIASVLCIAGVETVSNTGFLHCRSDLEDLDDPQNQSILPPPGLVVSGRGWRRCKRGWRRSSLSLSV